MALIMEDEDIKSMYEEAFDKEEEIEALAEINACSKERIISIVKDANIK